MATTPTATAIPQRTDIDVKHTWRLTDIFPSDQAWEAEHNAVKELLGKAATFKGRLAESPKTLYECLDLRSEVSRRAFSLYHYAYLNKDLDNRVSKFQAMTDQAIMLSTDAGTAFSFVEPELLQMDEATLLRMSGQFPRTDVYDFYIKELIRSKLHVRSAEVEEVLAMSGVVGRSPESIFTMLDDADITYPSITDSNGLEIPLTKQRFFKILETEPQPIRKAANEAFYTPYKAHLNTIGASLSAAVSRDLFYTRTRHYGSCLERALDNDNIPLSVYHNLLETTEREISALHDYIEARRAILGLDKHFPYDLFYPLFPEGNFEVPYDDAVRGVVDACRPLGDDYIAALQHAFGDRWIDVYETQGKGSGAYNFGNYSVHPYVLMNYNDTVDNFFTLAHEMGHAMHSFLSSKTQPYPKAGYSIFVAEVASTLNEGLLMQYLLKNTEDRRRRLYLLDRDLHNCMGTFFHQVQFARFELMIHEHVEKGEALSPDILTNIFKDLAEKYYGNSMTYDEYTFLKWARIPHFYNMYYVYQYATSFAASQAILAKFLAGEKGIVARYLEMLSSGGKDHPIELLKICGVDMSTPEAINATIALFRQKLGEMKELAGV